MQKNIQLKKKLHFPFVVIEEFKKKNNIFISFYLFVSVFFFLIY